MQRRSILWRFHTLASATLVLVVFAIATRPPVSADDWHHPLYLAGDGYWHARLPVVVHNDTDHALDGHPVSVELTPLAGSPAEAVRVCTSEGVEMLFALESPEGREIASGPLPVGTTLSLPVECQPGATAEYFVYGDNPSAGEVPDMLKAKLTLANGDLEYGNDSTPFGWRHDSGDEQHKTSWSNERPQSGKQCLKTVVADGAKPTWISTRQTNIAVDGGARYRIEAWVRAENVQGNAGWYLHVGNAEKSMLLAPTLNGGDGTYDWKLVSQEFTAPQNATRLSLGTVLRGTGTAWFDNVALTRLTPGKIRVELGQLQHMELHPNSPGNKTTANAQTATDGRLWRRAVVKAFNFSQVDQPQQTLVVDLRPVKARARAKLDTASIRMTQNGQIVPCAVFGDQLLVTSDLPKQSETTWWLDFAETATPADTNNGPQQQSTPDDALQNLVVNPGFERGDQMPDVWQLNQGQGVMCAMEDPGRADLGKRCVRIDVIDEAARRWPGWRQTVDVKPNRTYLISGWMKCREVNDGKVQFHFHLHQQDGSHCTQRAFNSAGPAIEGNTEWTQMSTLVTTPADAARLTLNLTTNTSGTIWHDQIVVADVTQAAVVAFCSPQALESSQLAMWQVPAVEKVFPDDPAPANSLSGNQAAAEVDVALARNERETLQLAVRSGRAIEGVRLEVDAPVGPGGAKLDRFEVNVVGYVPVDHPTSYYHSKTPPWHRKFPKSQPRCDGWPGMWPDPLLPSDTFTLAPNATQAVWVTFATDKDTPSGDYRGRVRFVGPDGPLAEVPVKVHVWDFALPDKNHLKAIYDVRLGPGNALWGAGIDDVYPRMIRFMRERRLCPDKLHAMPKLRYVDGQVEADFTEFDQAAEVYFNELGFPHSYMPWNFYLFGWAHPPAARLGIAPYEGEYPYEDVDRTKLRPKFKQAYQACLKAFWDHVKAKGWQDKFILYISDEPHFWHEHIIGQMKALCEMIHEVDPAIPIYSSTWSHVPEWDGSLDVWGIGHYGRVPVEQIEKLKAAGDTVWFTTDGQMCLDTPYCATERLLPYYCFKYGAEAYEFWGIGWLTYDPFRYGWHSYIRQADKPGDYYWVRYPCGDGFLIYPGNPIGHQGLVSSIRLEQAREGVEEYEYLYLLRELVAQAKQQGKDTTRADRALALAAELVTIPNAGGRYTSQNLDDPTAIDRARRAVAEAIEAMQ